MNKINQWVIGTLPYTILLCYFLVSRFDSSYYFILGATCVVLFVLNFFSNKQFVIHNYTYFILLFGIYMVFSNAYIAQNKFTFYNEVLKNQFIYAFFILNIIENTTFTKRQISWWFRIFVITIWASLIVILIQQFYDREFFKTKSIMDELWEKSYLGNSEVRLISIYSWSGVLDIILYFIPISFFVVNYELNRANIGKALMYTFIVLVVTVLSKSRTSMMPASLVLLVLLVTKNRLNSQSTINRTIILILVLLASYVAFSSIPFLNQILKDRILETSNSNEETRTMHTRIIAIEAFIRCFPDQPILGAGNTKYSAGAKGQWNYKLTTFLAGRSSQIHVGFLSLFYLYGLVGGSLFVIFMYLALKRLYVKSKQYNFTAVFWGLMVLPVANIGLVSFNVISAGVLLSFVLCRNLEVFCETTEANAKNRKLSPVISGLPPASIS